LELILALEDEFKIRFSAEQAANMDSLEDIVNILGGNG
jgi:acyl carrier protein